MSEFWAVVGGGLTTGATLLIGQWLTARTQRLLTEAERKEARELALEKSKQDAISQIARLQGAILTCLGAIGTKTGRQEAIACLDQALVTGVSIQSLDLYMFIADLRSLTATEPASGYHLVSIPFREKALALLDEERARLSGKPVEKAIKQIPLSENESDSKEE